jgi:RNA polymerase sigma-70 factor (ECF subfamily)
MEPEVPDPDGLLEKVRQGDELARQRLLALPREPVRRMISLRLDPAITARLDASDVVQEVLLEASRRLDDYLRDPAMPFALWLRHIARDHHRRLQPWRHPL